jgi:hypothetical protein
MELHFRGVRQRHITEITPENIEDCKKLMKFQELRHLDELKGYLGIADGKLLTSHAYSQERKTLSHMVISNVRVFVEQQLYIFQTLWDKAMPAHNRIREIEEGIKPEVIETLREPELTQARTFEMIKSAKDEVLVIFSTSNALRRQVKAGALDFLIKAAKSKGLKVRILSPFDEYVKNIFAEIKKRIRSE